VRLQCMQGVVYWVVWLVKVQEWTVSEGLFTMPSLLSVVVVVSFVSSHLPSLTSVLLSVLRFTWSASSRTAIGMFLQMGHVNCDKWSSEHLPQPCISPFKNVSLSKFTSFCLKLFTLYSTAWSWFNHSFLYYPIQFVHLRAVEFCLKLFSA